MKKSLLLCTAAAVLFSFSARAGEMKPYASVKAVYSWEKAKTDDGQESGSETFKAPGLNVAVGVNLKNGIRLEGEYGYRALKSKTDASGGIIGKEKFGIQTYMLNGYYDFATGTKVKPYIGAGLGLADVKLKYQDPDDLISISKTKFAWNLNAGIGMEVSKNMVIDLGYRYLQVEDFKKDFGVGSLKFKTHANEVSLGVRYHF